MDAESPKPRPTGWLHKILAAFSLEWIVHLLDLIQALSRIAIDGHHTGMYEILEYESTLELLDPHGKKAVFHKHQRVKFLHPTNKLPLIRRRMGENGSRSLTRRTFFSSADFAY